MTKFIALPLFLFFLLSGCATSISLQVEHPPNLNTAGIKRIAVMPFEAASGAYREMAQYATTAATSKISELNYFTLVAPAEIERLKSSNQSIENSVDALFSGKITRIGAANKAQEGSYKNKDGETIQYIDYSTNVEIEFTYSLVRSRDGNLVGPVSKRGTKSATSRDNYPSTTPLLMSAVDEQLRFLGRDIAPYSTTETRVLLREKTKDKALKAEMKDINAMVAARNYRAALEAYLGVYEQNQNYAAAENAAILYEALGDSGVALNFMQNVYSDTGNPKARQIISRLNRSIQDQAILASDYRANSSGRTELAASVIQRAESPDRLDKVASFAAGEIEKALSAGTVVWIYNKSSLKTAADITDAVTSGFIVRGIHVVDWRNAMLVNADYTAQVRGFLNDNDIINIANAAGADAVVMMNIAGTGAAQYLQVQVIDITRRIPIMQSDTGDNWLL